MLQPAGLSAFITILGSNIPLGTPPGFTIQFFIALRELGTDWANGYKSFLWPYAIQEFTDLAVIPGTGAPGTIPNPLTMTPLNWSVEST